MTIEELEIIVSVKIAESIKEFKKIVPAIKQTVQKAQESFEKMDTTKMKKNINQAVQQIKKKMQDLKKSNENNQIKLKVNNKDAQKQISQIQKQIDSLNEKINSRQMKLNTITPRLDEITARTTREITPQGVSPDNPAIQKTVNNSLNSNKEYTSLLAQESKMTQEIAMYNNQLTIAKNKMAQLKSETNNTATSQNKLTSFFNGFGSKIKQTLSNSKGISNNLKELPKIINKINFNGLNKGMKRGLSHVFRYAGALLSLESIYGLLSSSANAWLNSQNAGAQQLNANIEYMRYAMGSALAPVIQFVTNLVYQLMKAVQSVVYALTGVNIFANAGAKAYSNMTNSAKRASKESKQLAGVHDEINNISSNDSNSGGGGNGNVAPSIDLSEVDTSKVSWIDKIKERLSTLFEPIKNSWDTYGQPLMESIKYSFNSNLELIKTIGKSFEEVWLNGTGEQTCNTILQILTSIFNTCGNINKAFKEAWENNSGTEIIQNLWDGLNNVLGIIQGIAKVFENWTSSESFQVFADSIIQIFNTLSSWVEIITQKLKEIWDNGGSYALNSLLEVISKIVEFVSVILDILSPVVEFILNIVTPIISGIVQAIGFLIDALGGLLDFIIGVFTGDWERAWQGICDFFTGIWNTLKTIVETVWNAICSFLSAIWEKIKGIATTIWTAISEFFSSIWDGIKNVAMNVWNAITTIISNVINGIRDTISNVLNTISTIWNNIWNGLKNTVVNIFNGIWNAIRGVINSILGGIEGMANGIVRGINKVIDVLNNLQVHIPDWIPLFGGKNIGFHINHLGTVSLPRLAKGGVLYEERAFVGGEYSGARTNPEIVTPQNIMRETMEDVLSNYGGNNDKPIYLTVNVGNKKLGQILLDDLKDKKRRTGSGIEALVGG